MEQIDDGVEINDDFNFGKKETTLTIKDIILRQINKMGDICSKELIGSYWEKKPVKMTDGVFIIEIYHEDLREAYCNCINFILNLTYPYADNELMRDITQHEKEMLTEKNVVQKLIKKDWMFRKLNCFYEREKFFNNDKTVKISAR